MLLLCQLLNFSTTKKTWEYSFYSYHSKNGEASVVIYIGHMIHSKMRKLDIVDKLCDLGFQSAVTLVIKYIIQKNCEIQVLNSLRKTKLYVHFACYWSVIISWNCCSTSPESTTKNADEQRNITAEFWSNKNLKEVTRSLHWCTSSLPLTQNNNIRNN